MATSDNPPRRKRFGRIRALVCALASLTSALVIVGLVALYAYEKRAWSADPGNDTLTEVCGHCHEAERTHLYAKSPADWDVTIDRMLIRDPGHRSSVTAEQRRVVLETLVRRRSADGDILFHTRCSKCHSPTAIDDYRWMEPDVLDAMVERHVIEHNVAIATWEGAMIRERLRKRFAKSQRPPTIGPPDVQLALEVKCRTCHTISFVYDEILREGWDEGQWLEIVDRMREKTPLFITADDVQPLTAQVLRMQEAIGPKSNR